MQPKRNYFAALLATLALAVAGCGGSDGDEVAPPEDPDTTADTCKDVQLPEPKQVSLKAPKPLKPKPGSAVVDTSCGSFTIKLDTRRAPKTSASFEHMAKEGLYDDTTFHRVVPGFVVQGGDPLGDGTGGPGYFIDEPPPSNLSYTKGVVAMAKSQAEPPGRSGSQFFVVVQADAGLPPDFALLGKVTSGQETIDAIVLQGDPSSSTGAPLKPIVINSVTLQG